MTYELTDRDRMMLDLERRRWKYIGAKDAAIREQMNLSSVRYYQVLNVLIDRVEALAAEPVLVMRLRRIRAARSLQRQSRAEAS